MQFPQKSLTRQRVLVVALWTFSFLLLGWVTVACLFGHVEHAVSPHMMRGGDQKVHVILMAPPRSWPGNFHVEVLEDGFPLSRSGAGLELRPQGSDPNSVLVFFSASDQTNPRINGRQYVVRYLRRLLPASIALLLACWLFVPACTLWLSRRIENEDPTSTASDNSTAGWCAVTAASMFSLFAIQAWLFPSNVAWFLVVVAAGFPAFLVWLEGTVLGERSWSFPGWWPWLVSLLAWGACTAFGTSSYASWSTATAVLLMMAWGLVLYFGLRGSLLSLGENGVWLMTGFFGLGIGLILAREARLGLVSVLASLGLASTWGGAAVNPWTTKFLGHWALILSWSSLAVFWRLSRERRPRTGLLIVVACLAIGVNGSKSALAALAFSAVAAMAAFYWGRAARKLLISTLLTGVLLTPFLAGIPWQAHLYLHGDVPEKVLNALDLDLRGGMWEFSRRLTWLRPFEGWGIGSTSSLPGGDLPMAETLGLEPGSARPWALRRPTLAGGHPHNAALLTWLDLGLVGALLLAGLLLAIGRSIAATEGNRRVHAALIGLLTVNVVYLAFNYPAWEPEVMSILWMSAVLASVALPKPKVPTKRLLQDGVVVLILLGIGGGFLAQERLSRWLMVREFRQNEVVLDASAGKLLAGEDIWRLDSSSPLDAEAELLESGVIRGWVYDPLTGAAPEPVLLFVGSRLLAVLWPEHPSPELFARTRPKSVSALTAGFAVPVDPQGLDLHAPVNLVALGPESARFVELPPLNRSAGADGAPSP